jgi:hypothetical protein
LVTKEIVTQKGMCHNCSERQWCSVTIIGRTSVTCIPYGGHGVEDSLGCIVSCVNVRNLRDKKCEKKVGMILCVLLIREDWSMKEAPLLVLL